MGLTGINDQKYRKYHLGRPGGETDGSVGAFVCRIVKRCAVTQKGVTLRLDQLSFKVTTSSIGMDEIEVTDM